jgi:hypothetical protein
MITEKGSLVFGVPSKVSGEAAHKDFVMRAATIADSIVAVEKAGDNPSYLRVRVHKAAEQMESLGSLAKEDITADLLLALPEEDLEPIFDAQDALEKKLQSLRNDSSPTDSSK